MIYDLSTEEGKEAFARIEYVATRLKGRSSIINIDGIFYDLPLLLRNVVNDYMEATNGRI